MKAAAPDFIDWYAILGVSPEADNEALLRAWRRSAQRHHPDRLVAGASTEMFIQAKEAFRVLSDPPLRSQFDIERSRWLEARSNSSAMVLAPSGFSVRDWWRDIRDDRRAAVSMPQADQASAILRVPLRDIIQGVDRVLRLRVARTCPRCEGRTAHCQLCSGTGQRFVDMAWTVHVPPGLVDGAILRLRGQGHHGPRFGSPGDVLIKVLWTRRGSWRFDDGRLLSRVRVPSSLLEAGGRFHMRSPTGEKGWISIPAGSGSALQIRLPGQGLPDNQGRRGDAWVECFSAR
jgi:DnaJ-class molecular chaperone